MAISEFRLRTTPGHAPLIGCWLLLCLFFPTWAFSQSPAGTGGVGEQYENEPPLQVVEIAYDSRADSNPNRKVEFATVTLENGAAQGIAAYVLISQLVDQQGSSHNSSQMKFSGLDSGGFLPAQIWQHRVQIQGSRGARELECVIDWILFLDGTFWGPDRHRQSSLIRRYYRRQADRIQSLKRMLAEEGPQALVEFVKAQNVNRPRMDGGVFFLKLLQSKLREEGEQALLEVVKTASGLAPGDPGTGSRPRSH